MNQDFDQDDTYGVSCSTYDSRILRILEGGHGMNEPYVQVGLLSSDVSLSHGAHSSLPITSYLPLIASSDYALSSLSCPLTLTYPSLLLYLSYPSPPLPPYPYPYPYPQSLLLLIPDRKSVG